MNLRDLSFWVKEITGGGKPPPVKPMTNFIFRMLKQTAVYWPPTGVDTNGQPTWGTAIEVEVRWEKKQRQFMDSKGTRRLSKAVVFTKVDVLVQGILWLGKLSGVTSLTDPKLNTNAFEIMQFNKDPSVDGKKYLREALL